MNLVQFSEVEEIILKIRGESVILDSDVTTLYGVETREINQACRAATETSFELNFALFKVKHTRKHDCNFIFALQEKSCTFAA